MLFVMHTPSCRPQQNPESLHRSGWVAAKWASKFPLLAGNKSVPIFLRSQSDCWSFEHDGFSSRHLDKDHRDFTVISLSNHKPVEYLTSRVLQSCKWDRCGNKPTCRRPVELKCVRSHEFLHRSQWTPAAALRVRYCTDTSLPKPHTEI